MPPVIRLHRRWTTRLREHLSRLWRSGGRAVDLHELDARTLADLGLDRSEVTSVLAEARREASATRLRIAALVNQHG